MLLLEKPGQLSNQTPTAFSHPSPSLSFSYLSFSLVYILSRLKTYKRVSRKDSSKKKKNGADSNSFLGFPCGSAGKESACNAGYLGSIPGLERSPGEGKVYLLQYPGLEISMDCIVRENSLISVATTLKSQFIEKHQYSILTHIYEI